MYRNIETTMQEAELRLQDLLAEYEKCLHSKDVSDRAIQLTHDVCVHLRNVLDRTARRYWEARISADLSEKERKMASVYFPIAKDIAGLDSTLGRWQWKSVRDKHQALYDYLLGLQPFSSRANGWLQTVNDLAVAVKHIDLIPQKRTEQTRTTVSRPGGSAVSWTSGVRFSGNIRVMGAPIDTATQRIVPTPGVVEQLRYG